MPSGPFMLFTKVNRKCHSWWPGRVRGWERRRPSEIKAQGSFPSDHSESENTESPCSPHCFLEWVNKIAPWEAALLILARGGSSAAVFQLSLRSSRYNIWAIIARYSTYTERYHNLSQSIWIIANVIMTISNVGYWWELYRWLSSLVQKWSHKLSEVPKSW